MFEAMLMPWGWIYGLGVRLRNWAFDLGLLRSRSFRVPVIAVGNITVGGTGKTPHVEYLVRLLSDRCRVAVLSRGYKRTSSGFLVAGPDTTMRDIGDEPMQMHRKFPAITVAVDRKRVHGIEQLIARDEQPDVVLLDDAFQHRYVKPGINILLVDYHRLIVRDCLLPAGRLREPSSGKRRADIVIVTKCPTPMHPADRRTIAEALDLDAHQQLYFTTLDYAPLRPVFPEAAAASLAAPAVLDASSLPAHTSILLLTGIASPRQIVDYLSARVPFPAAITPLTYPDHHDFRPRDVVRINRTFAGLPAPRIIITTEKDEVRLAATEGLSPEVRRSLYALPIRVTFVDPSQEEQFRTEINNYVQHSGR